MKPTRRQIDPRESTSAEAKRPCSPIIHHPLSIINLRAFTLIELLVFISLVAILMAVLLPAVQRVHRQAKAIRCQATLRQSGVCFAAYAAENDGWLAMGPWDERLTNVRPSHPALAGDERWMRTVLGPSLSRRGMLLCPMAFRPQTMPDLTKIAAEGPPCATGTTGDRDSAWALAYRLTDGSFDTFTGSLGFNIHAERWSHWGGKPDGPRVDIRGAAQVPAHMDCMIAVAYASNSSESPPTYEGCFAGDPAFTSVLINRHDGGINCLFLDWSVRKVGMKEIWKLKWYRSFDTNGCWTKAGGAQPEDWPVWMRGFKDY